MVANVPAACHTMHVGVWCLCLVLGLLRRWRVCCLAARLLMYTKSPTQVGTCTVFGHHLKPSPPATGFALTAWPMRTVLTAPPAAALAALCLLQGGPVPARHAGWTAPPRSCEPQMLPGPLLTRHPGWSALPPAGQPVRSNRQGSRRQRCSAEAFERAMCQLTLAVLLSN